MELTDISLRSHIRTRHDPHAQVRLDFANNLDCVIELNMRFLLSITSQSILLFYVEPNTTEQVQTQRHVRGSKTAK